MSYREYVIAAYAIFAIMLLWDYVVPRIQVRNALRTAKQRIARTTPTSSERNAELPLSRD